MRRSSRLLVACLLAGLTCPPGRSDAEGLRELATEGLSFALPAGVVIASQDIAITLETVTFRYQLINRTDGPATVDTTLHLPDIDLQAPDTPYALPAAGAANYNGSRLLVEGEAAPLVFRQTATLGQADITQRLRDAHVPLMMVEGDTSRRALAALSPTVLQTWIQEGLLLPNAISPDGPASFLPAWHVRTWSIRHISLNAGQQMTIELKSLSGAGSNTETMLRKDVRSNDALRAQVDRLRKTYCVDENILGGIDRMPAKGLSEGSDWQERRLDIILPLTPADSPAEASHVSIDKERPDNILATCLNDLIKTAPTRFELNIMNAAPPHEIKLLILRRHSL